MSGAFYGSKRVGVETTSEGGDGDGFAIQFDSSKNNASTWSGSLTYDSTYNTPSSVGGGLAHNNMPPYRVVYRWHRVA